MLVEREAARSYRFAIPPSGLQGRKERPSLVHCSSSPRQERKAGEHLAGCVDLRDAGV
jgi:hypothetical protein